MRPIFAYIFQNSSANPSANGTFVPVSFSEDGENVGSDNINEGGGAGGGSDGAMSNVKSDLLASSSSSVYIDFDSADERTTVPIPPQQNSTQQQQQQQQQATTSQSQQPYFDSLTSYWKSLPSWELALHALSFFIVVFWLLTGSWFLNNVLGISLCVTYVSLLRLPSMKVAAVLLIGLFFYDIFWVFYSQELFGKNVMYD